MSETDFKRLKYLNMEIRVMSEELELLKTLRDYEAIKMDGMPKGNAPSNRVAKIAVQIVALEEKITNYIEEILEKWEAGLSYICSIEDPELRMIVRLRFIAGFTWEQIAERLHVDLSTVKRRYRGWQAS